MNDIRANLIGSVCDAVVEQCLQMGVEIGNADIVEIEAKANNLNGEETALLKQLCREKAILAQSQRHGP